MNFLKILAGISFLLVFGISCNSEKTQKKQESVTKSTVSKNIAVNMEKMEFHIKGMTCEIGCARLIQSKLSKKEGVKTAVVSFKDSLGMVEFDSNKLSKKEILNVVENIADGDLYKVTDNKLVTNFSVKK